jgi:hypothetical protein
VGEDFVADAKRSRPVAGKPTQSPASQPPLDPRAALAQHYLESARAKLAEEEAARPRSRRRTADGRERAAGFTFSVAPATFLHILLAALALTFDFLALVLTYHMMHVDFTVGRVVGLSTGLLTAAVLGYLSVCYLGIIESTSTGQTNVDSLSGDWREWFWTLPASVGMFALSAASGWGLSLVLPVSVWFLIAISTLITYPIFQLSSLETGSPAVPISLPVLASLVKHPLAWLVMYGISFAVVNAVWLVARLAWRDPPYGTMLVVGPIVTVALFFYAWLLGQLAHIISTGEEK